MDPRSPIHRGLAQEEILEDMICHGPDVDPAESPSSYLNPSEDGMELDRSEDEAEAPMMEKAIAPMMEKPVDP